jgi:cullin-associated NEDD8-dissociated protein 1
MSRQKETFNCAIEHFGAEQEEIRTAAAFAAGTLSFREENGGLPNLFLGNIAIGNLHQFLPVIVKMVQSDPKKRLLSLHALKEVQSSRILSSLLLR